MAREEVARPHVVRPVVVARARVAAVTVAAVVALSAAAARAEVFGKTYRSADFGVEITVPRGFEISEQRSYPGILARAFEHTTGARLSLAAQRLHPGETARAYVERNQQTLRKLNYKLGVATTNSLGAVILDGTTPDGAVAIRQAYVIRDDVAFILTLAVAPATMRYYGRAFDETLRSMSIARAPASAPASQPAAAETTTP
jgi:hypothetical protein